MAELHQGITKLYLATKGYELVGLPENTAQLIIAPVDQHDGDKVSPALTLGYFRNVRAVYPNVGEIEVISPEINVEPAFEEIETAFAFLMIERLAQLEEQQ